MTKSSSDRAVSPPAKRVAEEFAKSIGRSPNDPGTMRLARALDDRREPGFTDDPFDGGCPADSAGGGR